MSQHTMLVILGVAIAVWLVVYLMRKSWAIYRALRVVTRREPR